MEKMKLLITDKIDETKIEPLRKYFSIDIKQGLNEVELSKIISAYTCIITRSSTSVGKKIIENGDKLKIIARAGMGFGDSRRRARFGCGHRLSDA